MKYFKKIFSDEIYFVLFFSFLLIGLSFLPTIYEAFQANNLGDPRRIMLWGEHNFTYDYNVYLSKMLQGAEGRWTVVNKYTSEPHQGSLLQEFYLLVGKIGGWFRLSPSMTYYFLRIILGAGFLLAVYWLIAYFLKDSTQRKIAFLLALFSGSLPKFAYYSGGWHSVLYMDWWQEMDVIKRATYVPHYLLGHILTIVVLLFLLKDNILLVVLSAIIAGFVHPPSLLIVWGIWGMRTVWKIGQLLAQKSEMKSIAKYLVEFIILTLAVLIPLFYINQVTSIYPWKTLTDFDRAHPLPFRLSEYLLALGITFFLGVGGMVIVFWRKKEEYFPLVFWVLATFLGIIIFKYIPLQSEVRFVQVAVHLPLVILSTLALLEIASWVKRKIKLRVLIWLAAMVLILSLPGIYASLRGQIQFINERTAAFLPLVPYPSQVMYPLKDWWQGIEWLEENTKRNEVVLSDITAGNYIPAYSGNTVYLGHSSETVFYDQKKPLVNRFFNGAMTGSEAKDFLKKGRINYVFLGPQEKNLGEFKPYDFLEEVYKNDFVVIFEVAL